MKSSMTLALACGIACLLFIGCGPSAPRISLHDAVQKGYIGAVKQHIAAKSDLNKKDASGWTPLHLAAMNGEFTIVKVLCEAGAEVNIKGKDDKTPLDVAREKNQAEIVKFLQERSEKKPGGRRLIDGGLGVGEAMDNM